MKAISSSRAMDKAYKLFGTQAAIRERDGLCEIGKYINGHEISVMATGATWEECFAKLTPGSIPLESPNRSIPLDPLSREPALNRS